MPMQMRCVMPLTCRCRPLAWRWASREVESWSDASHDRRTVDDSSLGAHALVEETSRALEAATGLDAVVKVALDTLVLGIADLGVLVLDHAPEGHRVELVHSRPHLTPQDRPHASPARWRRSSRVRNPSAHEGRTARWIPSVTDASLRFAANGDQTLGAAAADLDVRSLITVALRTGGRTIGGLALARSSAMEPFLAADFATAQVLGRRIALAIDAAWLEDTLRLTQRRSNGVGDAIRKWARVFDLSWWGAALVDGVDRRIDTVNPAFARLHGYQRSRQPRRAALLRSAAPRPRCASPRSGGRRARRRSTRASTSAATASSVPVLVSVTPLDAEAHPGAYVVTVQDLSDLKRTEERLQRAQRTEAVGRLAGGVAHEVNNMMTIILGFSDLLSRERLGGGRPPARGGRDPEGGHAGCAGSPRSCSPSAASRSSSPSDLRLNSVIEEIVPVLRLMLPANIRVETALRRAGSVGPGGQVAAGAGADQPGIQRARRDGRRRDDPDRERIPAGWTRPRDGASSGFPFPPGGMVWSRWLDTGHGMDAETVAKVFEPFFTTKPVGSGHRPGPLHGLRHREAERRVRLGGKRARAGHQLLRVSPRGALGPRGRGRRALGTRGASPRRADWC